MSGSTRIDDKRLGWQLARDIMGWTRIGGDMVMQNSYYVVFDGDQVHVIMDAEQWNPCSGGSAKQVSQCEQRVRECGFEHAYTELLYKRTENKAPMELLGLSNRVRCECLAEVSREILIHNKTMALKVLGLNDEIVNRLVDKYAGVDDDVMIMMAKVQTLSSAVEMYSTLLKQARMEQ